MGSSSGGRIERCLSFDEKPLLLFQKLKDAQKNPVFMLKHIKEIRSPIAVAQQKQAARKASGASASNDRSKSGTVHSRNLSRPLRLQPQSDSPPADAAPHPGGADGQPGWPEIMPSAGYKERTDDTLVESQKASGSGSFSDRKLGGNGGEPPRSAIPTTATTVTSGGDNGELNPISASAREVPVTSDISYAVAIYPYMAEQEDEFDVVV